MFETLKTCDVYNINFIILGYGIREYITLYNIIRENT